VSDPPASGFTLIEIVVVVAVVGILLVAAVPSMVRAHDTSEAAGAARYIASVFARVRFDAARRQTTMAVRFGRGTPPAFTVVADGDGDGVGASDVAAGIDVAVGPADRLEDHFRRARFGIATTMPAIDESRTLSPADDPIRLGIADQWSVSPVGTATSGTVYVTSASGVQFAVRIAGATGRARVLYFDRGGATWRPY
jgi:prepilin-type N-terminal cleavage/methylation domain-containing protein